MRDALKIAMVCGHFYPFLGGVEAHVEQIGQHLAADGHHVEVFTQTDNRSWPKDEQLNGMFIHRFLVPIPSRNFAVSPAMALELRRRHSDFDVVHAHGYHTFAPLAAVAADCGLLVFTPHYHGTGHSPVRKVLHKPYRLIGARIVNASSRIICVSHAEAQLMKSHFPSSGQRTTVIPNGVDAAIATARPMSWPGVLILSAGRLEGYKHVDKTIAAMKYLANNFSLVVTGDGPERERLEAMTAGWDLRRRVTLRGRVDVPELRRWYRRADVYVNVSEQEAFSITTAEALVAGARVVASDIPAHRELAELARAAVALVPSEVTADALAATIRSAAAAASSGGCLLPTWRDVTDRTLEVYKEVIRSERRFWR